jgi:hypothetical protein
MTLKGITKIEFFGSQIKDGKEFHEGLNQNLTSNTVHEIIGSEPVIDQWQIATRGEMTGSFSDQFVYSNDIDTALPIDFYAVGKLITPILNKPVQIRYPYNTIDQVKYRKGNDPVNRLKSILIYSFPSYVAQNVWSIISKDGVISTTPLMVKNTHRSDGAPHSAFLPSISSCLNLVDQERFFLDALRDNLAPIDGLIYGSAQNWVYTTKNTLYSFLILGGSPKYYFNTKHYGHIADNVRQGLDGRFDSNPFARRNIITEAAVQTKFVKSNYDLKNGEFRTFSLIKPSDVDGTSYDTYQSSNISLFATSSLPFFDDNTVRNRTYGDSFIGVS